MPSAPWESPVPLKVKLHRTMVPKAASNPNNSLNFDIKTNPSYRPQGLILGVVVVLR